MLLWMAQGTPRPNISARGPKAPEALGFVAFLLSLFVFVLEVSSFFDNCCSPELAANFRGGPGPSLKINCCSYWFALCLQLLAPLLCPSWLCFRVCWISFANMCFDAFLICHRSWDPQSSKCYASPSRTNSFLMLPFLNKAGSSMIAGFLWHNLDIICSCFSMTDL